MSEEIELECFRLIEENDLDVNEFPERLQRKIAQLEDVIEEFNDCESDSEEEKNCELRMEAMDAGIVEDLQIIIAKINADEDDDDDDSAVQNNSTNQGNSTPNAGQNNNTNTGQNNTDSDAPSWRFWM
jgi:hypothetical protein